MNGQDISTVEFVAGEPAQIDVAVELSGVAFVQVWVDRDRDGVFDHPSEQVANEVLTTTGTASFPFTPNAGSLGESYMRVRVSSAGNLGPTGPATDGEVEDHRIKVISPGYVTPIENFNGLTFSGVNPPDTVGDAGPNHYVQATNATGSSQVAVFDKTGATLDTFVMDTLGGPTGDGDPIVLYDHLADRWLLAEFSALTNDLLVHISTGPIPTSNPADWFSYTFNTPNFPDYPKFSVWPDAYYVTTNENTGVPEPAVYALDRTNMLTNTPLRAHQRYTAPALGGFDFQALTPADLDGPAPPTGSPAFFARHVDDEVHSGASNTADFIEVYQFITDFNNVANSRLDRIANIPVAEFSSELCGLTSGSCFPQPGNVDPPVDPLREVLMWRLQYRNFENGTPDDDTQREVLVGNFTTDFSGDNDGGVRWFELRREVGGGWELHQEGEVSIGDDNRFMGAISMDGVGNIALGYNIIDTDVSGGLRYVGRRAGDPTGTMTMFEETIVNGFGSIPSIRWGDYSAMSVDPADDRTFWFTGEFANNNVWGTRIAAFAFDNDPGPTVEDYGVSIRETPPGTTVAEGGTRDTFSVALTSVPAGPVDITSTADGETELSTDGINFFNSVTYTLNSLAPQIVTVQAIDDGDFEFGDHISVITNEISQTNDPNFPAGPSVNVTVTVQDNDTLSSPLVAVDFGTDSLSPVNWTRIGTIGTPMLFNSLIDESGATTPINLRLLDSGGAILEQTITVDPLTLPTHIQPLDGVDDNVSIGATDTLTAIWDNLTPGVEYQIWVIAHTDSSVALVQDVTIAGNTTTTFSQTFLDTGLAINDESGSAARDLNSYPEIVQPDATGQITITIAANPAGSLDVVLSALAIRPILPELDYGDAPDVTAGVAVGDYQTLSANDGPSHLIVNGGVMLGAAIDSETDGQPNAAATGDDTTNSNDEDGVTFTSALIPGQPATAEVSVNGTGFLDAWIDFNQNGSFADPGEKVASGEEVSNRVGRLFATSRDILEDEIIEIDPTTGDTIRTFLAPQTVGILNGLAFDGVDIWYLEGIGGTQDILYRINADTGMVQQQFDLQALLSDQDYDGLAALDGKIYIQDSSNNRIQVLDPLAGTFQPIPIVPGVQLDGGLGAFDDPDNLTDALVATNRANKQIYLINPVTGIIENSISHNITSNTGIAVVGDLIYAADLDADIHLFQRDGTPVCATDVFGLATCQVVVQPSFASSDISLRSLGGGLGAVSGPRVNMVGFDVPIGAQTGTTYARFRVSSAGNLAPTGPASDGEVEDYQVGIGYDFGDAPDTTIGVGAGDYQTLSANDGPRHTIGGPRLGTLIDHDANGQPNAGATGDDTDGTDDEDGVVFGALTQGQSATANITVNNVDGRVDAWIDFNRNGSFADLGEKIVDSQLITAGSTDTVTFVVPGTAQGGTTLARVRVSRSGGLTPNGAAADSEGGEVEDYAVIINIPNLADGIGVQRGSSVYRDANSNGVWDGAGTDLWSQFGLATDEFFFGDWNGDGRDKIGVRRGSQIFLDVNGNGTWDGTAGGDRSGFIGLPTDQLVVGDWDGDNEEEIGLRRGNMVFLDVNGNVNWDGTVGGDAKYTFGLGSDTFLVGDWNGDGSENIGVHRDNRFYFDMNGNGNWDGSGIDDLIQIGNVGDEPFVGDFDGNGTVTWGLRRGDTYYRGGNTGSDYMVSQFGSSTDTLVLGDWNGDGSTDLGVQRGNKVYLDGNGDGRYTSTAAGDVAGVFGNVGDRLVVGQWTTSLTAVQRAAEDSDSPVAVSSIEQADLAPIVEAAIDLFADAGLRPDQIELLQQITVRIDDLGGAQLGRFDGRTITLDDDAAGYGWFVDLTPHANEEFQADSKDRLVAAGQSAASGQMDLLSAVLHEMGHALGMQDNYSNIESNKIMNGWLDQGSRRLPTEGELAEILFGK